MMNLRIGVATVLLLAWAPRFLASQPRPIDFDGRQVGPGGGFPPPAPAFDGEIPLPANPFRKVRKRKPAPPKPARFEYSEKTGVGRWHNLSRDLAHKFVVSVFKLHSAYRSVEPNSPAFLKEISEMKEAAMALRLALGNEPAEVKDIFEAYNELYFKWGRFAKAAPTAEGLAKAQEAYDETAGLWVKVREEYRTAAFNGGIVHRNFIVIGKILDVVIGRIDRLVKRRQKAPGSFPNNEKDAAFIGKLKKLREEVGKAEKSVKPGDDPRDSLKIAQELLKHHGTIYEGRDLSARVETLFFYPLRVIGEAFGGMIDNYPSGS